MQKIELDEADDADDRDEGDGREGGTMIDAGGRQEAARDDFLSKVYSRELETSVGSGRGSNSTWTASTRPTPSRLAAGDNLENVCACHCRRHVRDALGECQFL